jgi:hypothetical protein
MGAVDRQRRPRGSRRAARGRGDPGRPADQPHGGDHHGPPGALDVAATPGAVWVTNSGSGATAWRGSTRRPTGSPTARVRPGWATGTTTPCPGSTQRRTGSLVADPDRVPRRQPGGRHWRRLGHQRRPRGRRAPRTWWLCASTRRPTERSRRSPSVVTRSMSRQPRAPSGCRSQTPARRYGSPGANAASRPGCVSLSGSHDELGGTDGPPGVGGLQMRKARSPSTHPGLRAERLAAKKAAAPVNQSREAHHPARPLHSPEGPYGEPFATAAQPRVSLQPAAAFADTRPGWSNHDYPHLPKA